MRRLPHIAPLKLRDHSPPTSKDVGGSGHEDGAKAVGGLGDGYQRTGGLGAKSKRGSETNTRTKESEGIPGEIQNRKLVGKSNIGCSGCDRISVRSRIDGAEKTDSRRADGGCDGAVIGSAYTAASHTRSGSLFDRLLLNYKQAACYLSVSEPYLRRLKSQGRIPYVEFGEGRRRSIRFSIRSLDRWVETREIK